MRLGVAIALITMAAAVQAQNPLKPDDLVVPFRTMEGGEFVRDDEGNIVGRTGYTIRNEPQTGYQNTCWRVTEATDTSVTVELVAGTFRPHWEPDTAYETFEDVYTVGHLAPFPVSIEDKEFSIFRAVPACP